MCDQVAMIAISKSNVVYMIQRRAVALPDGHHLVCHAWSAQKTRRCCWPWTAWQGQLLRAPQHARWALQQGVPVAPALPAPQTLSLQQIQQLPEQQRIQLSILPHLKLLWIFVIYLCWWRRHHIYLTVQFHVLLRCLLCPCQVPKTASTA